MVANFFPTNLTRIGIICSEFNFSSSSIRIAISLTSQSSSNRFISLSSSVEPSAVTPRMQLTSGAKETFLSSNINCAGVLPNGDKEEDDGEKEVEEVEEVDAVAEVEVEEEKEDVMGGEEDEDEEEERTGVSDIADFFAADISAAVL